MTKTTAVTETNTPAAWDRIFTHPDKAHKAEGRYFYRLALAAIRAGDVVCDAGCGNAFFLPDLMARCAASGAFVGVDYSSVAVKAAARAAAPYRNARLVLADLRHLPLADASVDRTLCAETLPYLLADVEPALAELARISRRQVVFSLHTRATYEIKGMPNEFRGNVVIEHTPGAKPPRRVFEQPEIETLVDATGTLSVERIQPLPWADLMDLPAGSGWPWYLPPPETIALYYVIAEKTSSGN